MEIQRKIVESKNPPSNKEVWWFDSNTRILKRYTGPSWEEVHQPLIEVTYAKLCDLKQKKLLKSGTKYRITDYVTTTVQEGTRSAGHQFDLVVQALDESTLSEKASAIQHEGDTYFANSNLEAWQVWYRLDNDTSLYAWADATNGKGVIYRLIDEWQNDVPYDFKNIQHEVDGEYYYTFDNSGVDFSANQGGSATSVQNNSIFTKAGGWSDGSSSAIAYSRKIAQVIKKGSSTFDSNIINVSDGSIVVFENAASLNRLTMRTNNKARFTKSVNESCLLFASQNADATFGQIGQSTIEIIGGNGTFTINSQARYSHIRLSKPTTLDCAGFAYSTFVGAGTFKAQNSSGNMTGWFFNSDIKLDALKGSNVKLVVNSETMSVSKGGVTNLNFNATDWGTTEVTIDISAIPNNTSYAWNVSKNTSGEIKQWCDANLV